jgi:hypothetical protein
MIGRLSLFLLLMKFFTFVACAILSLHSFTVFAQTPKQIETTLLKSFKKIDYWYKPFNEHTVNGSSDSLSNADSAFAQILANYAIKYPATIQFPFDSLSRAGLAIATSQDTNIRVYSWDSHTGGMQPEISSVFQYKSGKNIDTLVGIVAKPYGSAYYTKIYRFEINGKVYYPMIYESRFGGFNFFQGISIFAIENKKLRNDVKLIKTRTGLNNYLSCYYESTANETINNTDILFDPKKKIITLPLIDENNHATGKTIVYRFTGQYFEKVKN